MADEMTGFSPDAEAELNQKLAETVAVRRDDLGLALACGSFRDMPLGALQRLFEAEKSRSLAGDGPALEDLARELDSLAAGVNLGTLGASRSWVLALAAAGTPLQVLTATLRAAAEMARAKAAGQS